MSLPFENHPELEELFKDLGSKVQQTEQLERTSTIASFRADVMLKMQQSGITANNAWMFFRSYRNNDDYPGLPDVSKVDTLVIKQSIDTNIKGARVVKRPYIRIFEVEELADLTGYEHIVRDCMLDQDGDTQCLTDLIYVTAAASEAENDHSTVAREKAADLNGVVPILSLPQVKKNGTLTFYFHALQPLAKIAQVAFDPSDRKSKRVAPFGSFDSSPWDSKYALEEIIRLFEGVKDREPDHIGEVDLSV